MADITIPVIGGASKRLKDMGDGTHAEVVATALSLDGVQIEGGGLTPAESAALQAVATESAQIQQIVHEAAIRIAVEAVAAVIAGGRLKVDGSGVTQPVSAAALPLPAGAATAAAQATQIAAEQAISTVLGTTADAVPADTSAAGTVPAWLRWLARGIGAPADAAASSDTAAVGLLALFKRSLQSLTTIIGRLPALSSGRIPVEIKSQSVVTYEISIAGLVAGASALSPVIDLGNNRPSLLIIAEKFNGANQGDTLQFIQSNDVGMGSPRPGMRGDAIGNSAGFSQAVGQQSLVYCRPTCQFMQAQFTCASGGATQPAGAVFVVSLHWGR